MQSNKVVEILPDQVLGILKQIGSDLSLARRARRISQQDMAARVGVSRGTIARMEAGDPRVSFGAMASAAWVLGMEKTLAEIFNPDIDPQAIREARFSLPRKVRPTSTSDDTPELDF